MRISGGTSKGRRIFESKSTIEKIRPTSSKVREAIFDIIRDKIEGASFVDLYAGTGTVGFEALSRGCREVIFVEQSKSLVREIKRTACNLGYHDRVKVIRSKADEFLKKVSDKKVNFDIFFIDPPYFSDEIEKVLPIIGEKGLLSEDGVIIVEHFFKKKVPESFDKLLIYKNYRYGDTMLTLYRRKKI